MGWHWHVTLCRGHTTLASVRQGPAVGPLSPPNCSCEPAFWESRILKLVVNNSFPSNIKTIGTVCCEYHIQINNIGFFWMAILSLSKEHLTLNFPELAVSALSPHWAPYFVLHWAQFIIFHSYQTSPFWSRAESNTLNDARMSLLLAAGCLPQSGTLFGFQNSIFFFLTNAKLWSAGNHMNAAEWKCRCGVIGKCQPHDSAGACVLNRIFILTYAHAVVTLSHWIRRFH